MMGEPTYLIRYGVMGYVGRFRAASDSGAGPARGEIVVIQSDRGIELGELLICLDDEVATGQHSERDQLALDVLGPVSAAERQCVLRRAAPEDLARAVHAQKMKLARFNLCQRVLEQEDWTSELIDVEPLLDESATVLHYLGPHPPDVALLRARFRAACELDVLFERVGLGVDDEKAEELEEERAGDGCGSCDCGAKGGGCGAVASRKETIVTATSNSSPGHVAERLNTGCNSCGISSWMAVRGRQNR
jgi:PSP1 C-terminal conserved region